MDYDAFSDNVWCSGSDDWMQTQSDPTDTGSFFDENTNQLQWNRSTCNTPAPLLPDTTPITFGLEMGLTNKLPFFDGFSHASHENQKVTLGRVWMKLHDRRYFQFVWEELLSLVKRLMNQKLGFVALHRGGTLLGINADMEAAPLLGMADALLPTIDIPSVVEEVKDAVGVVKRNVRICYSHVKRGIPDVSHLPRDDQDRIHNFMYMETPEDVEEFKIWIRTLPDPNGVLLRWWEHKEMHEWLLPSVIQCLSDIDPDVWHVMEATTNFGEAQHAANNAQTGIGMGLVKSFIQHAPQVHCLPFISRSLPAFRYEILDTRRAAEIEVMLQSGNLHNPRNEVSHRYSSHNARRVNATEKAKHARAADEKVQAAGQAVVDAQAQLKQIRAESKSNSSGRVRAIRARKSQPTKSDAHGTTKDSCRKCSTAQSSLTPNSSTSGGNGTIPDETIPAPTVTTPEHTTRPIRNVLAPRPWSPMCLQSV
ncbi:hypothetical protein B0H10DRAFT_2439850 [Mycena sp. CBHHK59/15]|nr:hypothetical protein B0H10DRAFT_2439850 [Mycena sp. CBHHK59/15]